MTRLFLIFLGFACCGLGSFAQDPKDTSFNARLQSYFRLEREKKNEALLDCFHPKRFQFGSRAEVLQDLNAANGNEALTAVIDSTVIAALSPVFEYEGVQYRRADYRVYFRLRFKGLEDTGSKADAQRLEYMQSAFAGSQVGFDKATGDFSIARLTSIMGVKDEGMPWRFLTKANAEMSKRWYPQAVIDYFIVL